MTPNNQDDAVRDLVWILRRMFYVFIRWSEHKYGWGKGEARPYASEVRTVQEDAECAD